MRQEEEGAGVETNLALGARDKVSWPWPLAVNQLLYLTGKHSSSGKIGMPENNISLTG